MPSATATLATTTLIVQVGPGERHWQLASTAGITQGTRLWIDRELAAVEQLTGINNIVVVRRGVDQTIATPHQSSAAVTLGRGDQFYSTDPVGLPPIPVLVYPWINVLTGVSWVAQGDETGPGAAARIWAPITVAETQGPLGVRIVTTTIPS